MTIQEAQQKVDDWITTTGVRYFSELTNMAILTEEVGEVARVISRRYGDQSFKESDKEIDLADEFADETPPGIKIIRNYSALMTIQ
jgi:NTP pyrophosphatase (non-canonical NTP hydrolase)